MNRKRNKNFLQCLTFDLLIWTTLFSSLQQCFCVQETVLHAIPSGIRDFGMHYKSQYDPNYFINNLKIKPKELSSALNVEKYFKMEASDATDIARYSQPALDYQHRLIDHEIKVPSENPLTDYYLASFQNPSHVMFEKDSVPLIPEVRKTSKPLRDLRLIDSSDPIHYEREKPILGSNDKSSVIDQADLSLDSLFLKEHEKNNFTDTATPLLAASSNPILRYEQPLSDSGKNSHRYIVPVKKSVDQATVDESSQTESPKLTYTDKRDSNPLNIEPNLKNETPVVLSTHVYVEFVNHAESTETSLTTVVLPSVFDPENVSSTSPFDNESKKLSSGTVAGIVIGVLVCVTIISSAVIYLLYRRYSGKCTSVVEGKFNSDNCGYLDDSLRSSIYLNNHIELPKESSEEMSSLDNDSFLNSLETMTIQNYWADNSKNTKV